MPLGRAVLYLATVGALALAVRAVVRGPVPLGLALGALGGYLALVLCGVLFSRFGMFASVLCRGPKGARGVALTFDDGPDPATTPRILDMLDAAGAKATFFVIGHKAERHPELVRRIVAGGHLVGLHGYSHDRLFALRSARVVRRDLERATQVLESIVGERPRLFRAPVGHVSPPMARAVRELGLQVVGWTVKGLDGWRRSRPSWVLDRIVPRLADRAIVLLHDASERGDFEPASLHALPEILTIGARRSLEWVRVDAWTTTEPS